MKCRILYVIGQLRPGGQERQLVWLLGALDFHRYAPSVAVWSLDESDPYAAEVRKLGVPIYSLGSGGVPRKLLRLRRLARNLKPELVHSYSSWTNFAAQVAARSIRATAVGSIRADYDYERKRLGALLGAVSCYWPAHQIFNSSAAAHKARTSKGPFRPRHIHVVRNGLRLDCFRAPAAPVCRTTVILGVGSLYPVKRWDRILIAAQRLKKSGIDYVLRIAGDGPMKAALIKQAFELGIDDRVEFMGYHADVIELLAASSFLVLASESEGCPNVVMEAMACGRAVVATRVGDVPELVEAGRTGLLVDKSDISGLADSMAKLASDRALCRSMGLAGRIKAEREFSCDRLASETLEVYRATGWFE